MKMRYFFLLTFLLVMGLWMGYAYGTARTIVVEVTDKERVVESSSDGSTSSYWLVFTRDHDVLRNADSWLYLKFNSSSIYGKLEPGNIYKLRVYGWRIGLFSMYPNIISAKFLRAVEPPEEAVGVVS